MPDEQIIYLDPNDELPKVRERIEEILARHIILVVPQQTQLRSHVGWRLLHARAREMGKDVLVISTDHQIRAVAKAAGFKVADSQESPVSSKTRPGSRPSRSGLGGRTTQRPRTQSGRGAIDNRAPGQREQLPPRTKTAEDQPAQNAWREADSRLSRAEEPLTGQGKGASPLPPSPFTIEEDDEFDQPYEFRVDASQTASARPLILHPEDDLLPPPAALSSPQGTNNPSSAASPTPADEDVKSTGAGRTGGPDIIAFPASAPRPRTTEKLPAAAPTAQTGAASATPSTRNGTTGKRAVVLAGAAGVGAGLGAAAPASRVPTASGGQPPARGNPGGGGGGLRRRRTRRLLALLLTLLLLAGIAFAALNGTNFPQILSSIPHVFISNLNIIGSIVLILLLILLLERSRTQANRQRVKEIARFKAEEAEVQYTAQMHMQSINEQPIRKTEPNSTSITSPEKVIPLDAIRPLPDKSIINSSEQPRSWMSKLEDGIGGNSAKSLPPSELLPSSPQASLTVPARELRIKVWENMENSNPTTTEKGTVNKHLTNQPEQYLQPNTTSQANNQPATVSRLRQFITPSIIREPLKDKEKGEPLNKLDPQMERADKPNQSKEGLDHSHSSHQATQKIPLTPDESADLLDDFSAIAHSDQQAGRILEKGRHSKRLSDPNAFPDEIIIDAEVVDLGEPSSRDVKNEVVVQIWPLLANTPDGIKRPDSYEEQSVEEPAIASGIKKTPPMLEGPKTIDRTGEFFGSYRLVSKIANGKLGDVYLGEHIELGTRSIIKIIHYNVAMAYFQDGLRRIAQLEHLNILRILSLEAKNNTYYLVMDYALHGNLQKYLPKDTPLPLRIVVELAKEIATALQYAHKKKVAHGYLTPHHLLLGRYNQIVLSGFDNALIERNLEERPSSCRAYIAPEQLAGRLVPASDQYALAAMIYQWLSGAPLSNNGALATETPTPLHIKTLDVPPAVGEVVMKALARDEWQRYESVEAFINALVLANQSVRHAKSSQLIGQTFGNYRIIGFLGNGGFADVFLGHHTRLHTKVAVKVLHARLTDKEVEHFRNEARTLANLTHPHIVRVHDFGTQDNTPFLAMDYAPRGNLRDQYPKDTRLQLSTIISYVKQVALALQFAHNHGLVHRDVKPQNMLLGPNDQILLSDFGIAVIAYNTNSLTPQTVLGTLPYISPEQLKGSAVPASDQYSLGIVVYEWLSGHRPFNGSSAEIIYKHLEESPPSLLKIVPTILRSVEEVVMIALAKDPNKRFATVIAFANALEKASKK